MTRTELTQDPGYELPPGWVRTNLSELIQELESGSRPKGGVRGIRQGVPSVGGEHLSQSGGFDFSAVRFVPEAFAASMNNGWIQPHDILIVKDGATTGKTSFVDDQFPYSKAVLNEHVLRLRAVSEVVDQRYLFRFLWGQVGQRMIAKAFRGTAQGGINQSFPQFVDVPIAPLPEQRRIVAKIEALFEQSRTARQALDRIPPLLKKFRQSVLAAAFRGDLTRDWREQNPDIEPASALLERIRAERRRKWEEDLRARGKNPSKARYNEPLSANTSKLPDLPEAWIWTTMDAVAYRVTSGSRAWRTKCGSGTGTFILAQNIRPGLLDLSNRIRVNAPNDLEAFRTKVEVGERDK
jgi:type I restriction enzyme S subunit